jgi:uncharacterized protein YqgC (DUF456 family)
MHLLPELHRQQQVLYANTSFTLDFLRHHVYLIALLGLAAYYGLEHLSLRSRHRQRQAAGSDQTGQGAFRIRIAAFALYNGVIGYLLTGQPQGNPRNLIFFTLALMLHLIVMDFGLRTHHKEKYSQFGRWILVAALIAGSLIGIFHQVRPVTLAILIAFLAGAIILNVFKEELPDQQESHFAAFAIGALSYSALLLMF